MADFSFQHYLFTLFTILRAAEMVHCLEPRCNFAKEHANSFGMSSRVITTWQNRVPRAQ